MLRTWRKAWTIDVFLKIDLSHDTVLINTICQMRNISTTTTFQVKR